MHSEECNAHCSYASPLIVSFTLSMEALSANSFLKLKQLSSRAPWNAALLTQRRIILDGGTREWKTAGKGMSESNEFFMKINDMCESTHYWSGIVAGLWVCCEQRSGAS